jgi:hypothetical protein
MLCKVRLFNEKRYKVQGTGYKVKTIKENLISPYALCLAPCALLLQLYFIHVGYFQFHTHFIDFAVKIFYQSI